MKLQWIRRSFYQSLSLIILTVVCQFWATGAYSAEETKGIEFGNRTPECFNPEVVHYCSDYTKDGDSRGSSSHYFSVTCHDSCGNSYSFTDRIELHDVSGHWESAFSGYQYIEDFDVVSKSTKAQGIQQELDDLEKEQEENQNNEKALARRAAAVWAQILQRFPAPIIKDRGDLQFKDDRDLPSEMRDNLREINIATGQLTQLIAKAKEIRHLIESLEGEEAYERRSELENQITAITKAYEYISNNQSHLFDESYPSAIFLDDIEGVMEFMVGLGNLSFLPHYTMPLIDAFNQNPEIQKIIDEIKKTKDQWYENNRKMNELSQRLDPNSSDPSKKERCMLPDMKFIEGYPRNSPYMTLKKKLEKEITKEIGGYENEVLANKQRYLESLDEEGREREAYYGISRYLSGLVKYTASWISEKNILTEKFFNNAEGDDPKLRQKALREITMSCSSVMLDHKVNKIHAGKNKPTQSSSPARKIELGALQGTIILPSDKSQLLLAFYRSPAEKDAAVIYVLEDPAKPVSAAAICSALRGFCRDPALQAHESPKPSVDLDMFGISKQYVINAPIEKIPENAFKEILKASGMR